MTDKEKILAEIQKRIEFQNTCIKNDYRLTGRAEEEIIFEYQKLINFINSLPNEPVSEDLEKASFDNAQKNYKEGFRGAAMQAFNEGALWQKEQMIKEAISGHVGQTINGMLRALSDETFGDMGFTAGDKVKLIIIKEE